MNKHAPISRIYQLGEPAVRPDPERSFARIWRYCRDLWVKEGTIVARPSELPDDIRIPLEAWANETYGSSKKTGDIHR